MILTQLIINGLIAGSLYASVAVGFAMIYSTNRFVHFAHGTMVAFGAYMVYTLMSIVGLPLVPSIIAAIGLSGIAGLLMYRLVYEPLMRKKASSAILLIASIGLMILIENALLAIFGSKVKTISVFAVAPGFEIWGAHITRMQIIVILVSAILLAGITFFTKKTSWGIEMRAVADNPELAVMSGINTRRVQAMSFFMGSAIAGVAGVLIAIESHIEARLGSALMIKGFTSAIIGGMGSLPGAMFGSYVLGLVENIGIWFLPSGYKDAIAFVLLVLFLLWRPQGILGINQGIRK